MKGCLAKKDPGKRLGIGAEITRTKVSVEKRKVRRDRETRRADLGKGNHGVFRREEDID